MKEGQKAAAESRKILDNRGVDALSPYHALARLGLARVAVLQGQKAESRRAYEELSDRWKEADPDIPIVRRARLEAKALSSLSSTSRPIIRWLGAVLAQVHLSFGTPKGKFSALQPWPQHCPRPGKGQQFRDARCGGSSHKSR